MKIDFNMNLFNKLKTWSIYTIKSRFVLLKKKK